jgi:hypothetical protein
LGSNLPLFVASYAVCQGKEPPSGADLRRGRRWKVTETILIPLADQSWIGNLTKFEIQHQAQLYLFRGTLTSALCLELGCRSLNKIVIPTEA